MFIQAKNFTTTDIEAFHKMKDFAQNLLNSTAVSFVNKSAPTTPVQSLNSTVGSFVNATQAVPTCENLREFSDNYDYMHGYMCLAICIFGAVANLLNIVVLTRKEMNESPINRILTGNRCLQHFRGNWCMHLPKALQEMWQP